MPLANFDPANLDNQMFSQCMEACHYCPHSQEGICYRLPELPGITLVLILGKVFTKTIHNRIIRRREQATMEEQA